MGKGDGRPDEFELEANRWWVSKRVVEFYRKLIEAGRKCEEEEDLEE